MRHVQAQGMVHVALLYPAFSMHGILAWDALLVAGTGHGQVLHYSICHNLLSVYIECYSCVGFKQQGYSQTARSARLMLFISCGRHLLPC